MTGKLTGGLPEGTPGSARSRAQDRLAAVAGRVSLPRPSFASPHPAPASFAASSPSSSPPHPSEATQQHRRSDVPARPMESSPGLDNDLGLTPSHSPAAVMHFPSSSSAPIAQPASGADSSNANGASTRPSSSGHPKFSNGPCVFGHSHLSCAVICFQAYPFSHNRCLRRGESFASLVPPFSSFPSFCVELLVPKHAPARAKPVLGAR